MVFASLHNLAGQDQYATSELGQVRILAASLPTARAGCARVMDCQSIRAFGVCELFVFARAEQANRLLSKWTHVFGDTQR